MRYCLMSSKTLWHSTSHTNDTPFFIDVEKDLHFPARLVMKRWMYASHPRKPRTSLIFLKGCMSCIFNFLGSTWIHFAISIKPRNFSLDAPKKDFSDSFLIDEAAFKFLSQNCLQIFEVAFFILALDCYIINVTFYNLLQLVVKISIIAHWYVTLVFFKTNGITV